MSSVEVPMGNVEMRLAFANLQEEIGDVKGIALDTRAQTTKTNGHVADAFREIEDLKIEGERARGEQKAMRYVAGAAVLMILPILSASLWKIWNDSLTPTQIQSAVESALDKYKK